MRTVWKFELAAPSADVSVPGGYEARPLSVGAQGNKLVVWFEVQTDRPARTVRLLAYPTGEALPAVTSPGLEYVGTASVGAIVWHVWRDLRVRT